MLSAGHVYDPVCPAVGHSDASFAVDIDSPRKADRPLPLQPPAEACVPSGRIMLTAQTLLFESSAKARGANPTLEGSPPDSDRLREPAGLRWRVPTRPQASSELAGRVKSLAVPSPLDGDSVCSG